MCFCCYYFCTPSYRHQHVQITIQHKSLSVSCLFCFFSSSSVAAFCLSWFSASIWKHSFSWTFEFLDGKSPPTPFKRTFIFYSKVMYIYRYVVWLCNIITYCLHFKAFKLRFSSHSAYLNDPRSRELDLRLEIIDQSKEILAISILIHVLHVILMSDEVDAVLLHQWRSDENCWQTVEGAKKEFLWRTKSWMQAGTGGLPELVLQWSDLEVNLLVMHL